MLERKLGSHFWRARIVLRVEYTWRERLKLKPTWGLEVEVPDNSLTVPEGFRNKWHVKPRNCTICKHGDYCPAYRQTIVSHLWVDWKTKIKATHNLPSTSDYYLVVAVYRKVRDLCMDGHANFLTERKFLTEHPQLNSRLLSDESLNECGQPQQRVTRHIHIA